MSTKIVRMAAATTMVLFTGAARADDRSECVKAAGDEAIMACSRLITSESPALPASISFYNRGNAYEKKGELNAAMADFNEAIRLDVTFAAAYTARGTTYWGQGNPERALADWNE